MPIESLLPVLIQAAASGAHQAVPVIYDYGVEKAGDFAITTFCRGVVKVFNPAYKSQSELQRDDIETLKRVVDGMAAGLDDLRRNDAQRSSDRATDAFVAEALESALESPFAAKHFLLGRLIGERLDTATESRDDLFLRESLRIVRQANQSQLFSLGALYLVHHPPVSFMPHEALTEWWDTEYMPLLKRLVDGHWDQDDLTYLERLGAVERDRSVETPSLRTEPRHGPVINNVLARRGLPAADAMGSRPPKVAEFAIYCARLHSGSTKTTAWPALDFPLFPYGLTIPGIRVARTIIDSLSTKTIEEWRNSTTYSPQIR